MASAAKVDHITSDSSADTALSNAKKAGKPVLIDFFAEWCGPCKAIAPFVEDLAQKNPGIVFLKIDVDACNDTARKYEVRAMPTFFAIQANGEVLDSIKGADPKGLEALVARLEAKPSFAAFSGESHSLKDSSAAEIMFWSTTIEAKSLELKSGEDKKRVKLGRSVVQVNPSHTVGDLVAHAKVSDTTGKAFNLRLSARPPKVLDDPTLTLEEAGVLGAVVELDYAT